MCSGYRGVKTRSESVEGTPPVTNNLLCRKDMSRCLGSCRERCAKDGGRGGGQRQLGAAETDGAARLAERPNWRTSFSWTPLPREAFGRRTTLTDILPPAPEVPSHAAVKTEPEGGRL